MRKITQLTNNWANLFILAHEVGHHINGHTRDAALSTILDEITLEKQRQEELEADKFETIIYDESSGFELGKKGLLGPWFTNVKQRTGVSWGRCVLHRRIVENIENDERPLIWIVDEDNELLFFFHKTRF